MDLAAEGDDSPVALAGHADVGVVGLSHGFATLARTGRIVKRGGNVAVAEAVVARGVERVEQGAGRRLAQPVELAEDDQGVVAGPARQGPSCRNASTRRGPAARPVAAAARGGPRVDLPKHLTESRWARCAAIAGESTPDVVRGPWHWNGAQWFATPPGVACFNRSEEYAHGGLSIQECVIPDLVVRVEGAETAGSITSVRWRGLRRFVEAEVRGGPARADPRLARPTGESVAAVAKPVDARGGGRPGAGRRRAPGAAGRSGPRAGPPAGPVGRGRRSDSAAVDRPSADRAGERTRDGQVDA